MFDLDPNFEEEYWNVFYYFQCLDKRHREAILKELSELKD